MRVKISYEVELPDIPHTTQEIYEYIRFCTQDVSSISNSNAFYSYLDSTDLEPIEFSLNIEVQK